LITACLFASCGLLETTNDDEYSGEKFWRQGNMQNVEAFTLSIYNSFRKATMTNCAFMTATGDFRLAPVTSGLGSGNDHNILNDLIANQLATTAGRGNGGWRQQEITRWNTFYEVVQSANILIEEVENVPGITPADMAAYKAEGVFMRNLAYFFMIRVFGDVPYYTNAYNAVSLPRTDMVTALKNCRTDLQTMLADDPNAQALPWTHESAGKAKVRASRGAALSLAMHINLWLAQFDKLNAPTYYTNVTLLGDELVNRNGGVYHLLPINQSSTIFAGRSAESLFDVVQDVGMNELFIVFGTFSDMVSYSHIDRTTPRVRYNADFMEQLFPEFEPDARSTTWFVFTSSFGRNIDEIIKFVNPATSSDSRLMSNSGNQIIFRYADAILLYAEAAAELNDDITALRLLNMIRSRAQANEINSAGQTLKDDIYWERCRELIGEGHYYYDLVRTGKAYDRNYCPNAISRTYFNAGAWTWPIHSDAQNQNTKMSLNNFWVN
jgi:hypothetical protein